MEAAGTVRSAPNHASAQQQCPVTLWPTGQTGSSAVSVEFHQSVGARRSVFRAYAAAGNSSLLC